MSTVNAQRFGWIGIDELTDKNFLDLMNTRVCLYLGVYGKMDWHTHTHASMNGEKCVWLSVNSFIILLHSTDKDIQ